MTAIHSNQLEPDTEDNAGGNCCPFIGRDPKLAKTGPRGRRKRIPVGLFVSGNGMKLIRFLVATAVVASVLSALSSPAVAVSTDTLRSVVSVLPVWPGRAQGGAGAARGTAPEGSGVVLRPGVIATAWHVVEPADSISVRLSDGRTVPARLIGHDPATDIALLRVDQADTAIPIAPNAQLAAPVCAIGNAFGFGLSVTCGVVSALSLTNAGFNPVEDFVQTDAATNPGMSGGALVDDNGHLVGMLSAIFASNGQTNIGVNFAVSSELLLRVADALIEEGEVRYPAPGWRLAAAGPEQLAVLPAPVVRTVRAGGGAAAIGIQPGDHIVRVAERRVLTPRDAHAALAVLPQGTDAVDLVVERYGEMLSLRLPLEPPEPAVEEAAVDLLGDCPHPRAVCVVRQAVFPVSSFDPIASATRIAPDLLVTNRHVVGDRMDAVVHTPAGPRGGRVVPSAFEGDLILLQVDGLPLGGHVPALDGDSLDAEPFYAVGADVSRQEVRVFAPGSLIVAPAQDAPLGRIHTEARMQPGVSGGALVDSTGALVGIAVGGGEQRFEAIPIAQVRKALQLRVGSDAADVTERLGAAFAQCDALINSTAGQRSPQVNEQVDAQALAASCEVAQNQGQLLGAGRVLARLGDVNGAIDLHALAVEQVPNSINARMSLLVSLQLAARFDAMTAHARWLMEAAPDDPQALRFSIQAGVWGDAPELAEAGYQALLEANPRQAAAARRFIDNAPPAPPAR